MDMEEKWMDGAGGAFEVRLSLSLMERLLNVTGE